MPSEPQCLLDRSASCDTFGALGLCEWRVPLGIVASVALACEIAVVVAESAPGQIARSLLRAEAPASETEDAMESYRNELSCVEENIVHFLGVRLEIARCIGQYTRGRRAVQEPGAEVAARIVRLAAGYDVDPGFALRLFGLIAEEAARVEDDCRESVDGARRPPAAPPGQGALAL